MPAPDEHKIITDLFKSAAGGIGWTTVDTVGIIKTPEPVLHACVIRFAGVKPMITVTGAYRHIFHHSSTNVPLNKVGFTRPEAFLIFNELLTFLREEKYTGCDSILSKYFTFTGL